MTFQLLLHHGGPFEAQFLTGQGEDLAIVPIGHDGDTTYSLIIAMVLRPGHPANHKELIFYLLEVGPDGDYEIKTGLGTRRFLVGRDRAVVLDCICALVKRLAELCQPDVVSMTTIEERLPIKALSKYWRICEALRHAGYAGGQTDSYHGIHCWLFVKQRPEP